MFYSDKEFGCICPCAKAWCEANLEDGRLTDLVEELSSQSSGYCGRGTAFNQIYRGCEVGKAEGNDLKSLQFHQKGSVYELGTKESTVAKDISIKKLKDFVQRQ